MLSMLLIDVTDSTSSVQQIDNLFWWRHVVIALPAYALKEKHEAQLLSNVTIKNLTMGRSITFLLASHFCFSERNSENTIDEWEVIRVVVPYHSWKIDKRYCRQVLKFKVPEVQKDFSERHIWKGHSASSKKATVGKRVQHLSPWIKSKVKGEALAGDIQPFKICLWAVVPGTRLIRGVLPDVGRYQ